MKMKKTTCQQSIYYKVTSHAFGLANKYLMDGIEDWGLGLGHRNEVSVFMQSLSFSF